MGSSLNGYSWIVEEYTILFQREIDKRGYEEVKKNLEPLQEKIRAELDKRHYQREELSNLLVTLKTVAINVLESKSQDDLEQVWLIDAGRKMRTELSTSLPSNGKPLP